MKKKEESSDHEFIYIKNRYGVEVTQRCATCQLFEEDKCPFNEEEVDKNSLCDNYTLKKAYQNAGKGGGKIKKKSYLLFLLNPHGLEKTASILDLPVTEVGMKEMRKAYEKINGSIYYDL